MTFNKGAKVINFVEKDYLNKEGFSFNVANNNQITLFYVSIKKKTLRIPCFKVVLP